MSVDEESEEKCVLCLSSVDDPVKLGEKMNVLGLRLHYFCGVFSDRLPDSKINQRSCLLAEARRSYANNCVYCNRRGASIECAKCKIKFHLPCGQLNGALSQFIPSKSKSYCKKHKPKQKLQKGVLKQARTVPQVCAICLEEIDMKNPDDWIWPPCCKKNFLHRSCVQMMAHTFENKTKCCLCQNKDKFTKWISKYGVIFTKNTPNWLMFSYGEYRIEPCSAEECLCPYGRETFRAGTIWHQATCTSCLLYRTHYRCSNLSTHIDFQCPTCSSLHLNREHSIFTNRDLTNPDHAHQPSEPTANESII